MAKNFKTPEEMLPLTPIQWNILLSVRHESRHGYGILKDVERLSEGKLLLSAGTLYNSIKRMLKAGLIKVVDQEVHEDTDPRRTSYYRITGLGQRTLEAEMNRMQDALRAAGQKPVLAPFSSMA